MTGSLPLTLAYLRFHRWKTTLLVTALTLTIFLPLMLHQLISHTETKLTERARQTPMVAGARGDRYDLVVNSLYFTTGSPEFMKFGEAAEISETEHADTLPLHVKYTARKKPVVGAPLEYFEFRNLNPTAGTFPLRLGDCVLGASAAAELKLQVNDRLLTDQVSLFNIAASYPLNMRVAGILSANGSPDDQAVFTDLKTTWVIDGFAHGHENIEGDTVLQDSSSNVTANASVVEFYEVTEENLEAFHLHGEPADLPVSSILVLPHSDKDATLLKAEYNRSETRQMLVSTVVIDELLGIVFRVKRFFDASFGLVCLSTGIFIALVIMLSLRIRRREMDTMFKLGCSRGTMVRLQLTEWLIIGLVSLGISSLLAFVLLRLTPIWKLIS